MAAVALESLEPIPPHPTDWPGNGSLVARRRAFTRHYFKRAIVAALRTGPSYRDPRCAFSFAAPQERTMSSFETAKQLDLSALP
jgi:hypothetical protein